MTFTCGQVRRERAAAKSLADMGTSAVQEVEKTLASIETATQESPSALGAGWILSVYAKIKGPAASTRLLKMSANARPGSFFINLDHAFALAFDLTSYVSATRQPGTVFHCHRHGEPRDALDQLILAWVRNDLPLLEAGLGPDAAAALKAMLRGKTWQQFRASLASDRMPKNAALGYRFGLSGTWAQPDESLELDRTRGDAEILSEQNDFRIDTLFKDRLGRDCGRFHVNFVKSSSDNDDDLSYLVNNFDLEQLLGLINACAAV
jgi:hypothetical protein